MERCHRSTRNPDARDERGMVAISLREMKPGSSRGARWLRSGKMVSTLLQRSGRAGTLNKHAQAECSQEEGRPPRWHRAGSARAAGGQYSKERDPPGAHGTEQGTTAKG